MQVEVQDELTINTGKENRIIVTFALSGFTRALLQEIARHRCMSLTVRSTRYTLKELKYDNSLFFHPVTGCIIVPNVTKYVKLTGDAPVDASICRSLEDLRNIIKSGTSNDVAKYALPEAYRSKAIVTVKEKCLRNFLELRLSSSALKEIRELAELMYDSLSTYNKSLLVEVLDKATHEFRTKQGIIDD